MTNQREESVRKLPVVDGSLAEERRRYRSAWRASCSFTIVLDG